MDCCCLRSHCNVDCWSPHVCTTNCCAGVGNLVSYSVVTTSNCLATHCVVLDIHVRVALEVACTCNDCVGDNVVTNFTCWWSEDFVNDVDNTVGGYDIRSSYSCVISPDCDGSGIQGNCEFIPVCSNNIVVALSKIGRKDSARDYVVEENVSECCDFFIRVKCSKVNSCIGKGLIGWSKNGERPITL